MRKLFTTLLSLLLALGGAGLRAQTLDPAFQPTVLKVPYASAQQPGIQCMAVQPDGKLLVAGRFDFAGGALASKVLRLNADGTPDATFNPGGTGPNGFIGGLALLPSGKIIITGGFTVYNGAPALAQARLNADGTLDASFAALPLAGLRQLGAVALLPDGKLLVGGVVGAGAMAQRPVVRLNADGTLDASFSAPAGVPDEFVRTILVQADGKILLGGSIATSSSGNSAFTVGLQRLLADGSADNTFKSPFPTNTIVYALAQQPDGKLLVGGTLQGVGVAGPGVVRLNLDGSYDNTFATGTGPMQGSSAATVRALQLLPDGSILAGGSFTQYNGVTRGRLVRLLATGAIAAGYSAAAADAAVYALTATASGQALVAGAFTQYNGGARTGLVRVTATTGDEDTGFSPPLLEGRGSISRAVLLANGQLQVQGSFASINGTAVTSSGTPVRRFNTDGTLDATYSATASTMLNVQPDGSFFTVVFAPSGTQYLLRRVLATGAADNAFANPAFSTTGNTNLLMPQGITGQPDGRILVYGVFTTFGGASRNGLVRLNADGTVDNTFVPPAGALQRLVYSVVVQASGKLLLAYDELVAGSVYQTTGAGSKLLRLNTDGSVDNTFNAGGTGFSAGTTFGLLPLPNDKLLVAAEGGYSYNGQAVPYGLLRLTADGAIDNTFNQLAATYSFQLAQPDGKLLVTTGRYDALRLMRLNTDGSLDNTFAPISVPQPIFIGDNIISGYLYQPADGKLIVYGSFSSVLGQVRVGLARLVPGVVTATRPATSAQPLEVYPNPTRRQLTVVLPAPGQPMSATLLSLTGQPARRWVLPTGPTEAQLDLGPLAAGLYVLRLTGPAGTYQQKVVVTP